MGHFEIVVEDYNTHWVNFLLVHLLTDEEKICQRSFTCSDLPIKCLCNFRNRLFMFLHKSLIVNHVYWWINTWTHSTFSSVLFVDDCLHLRWKSVRLWILKTISFKFSISKNCKTQCMPLLNSSTYVTD